MRLFTENTPRDDAIQMARDLNGSYDTPAIFHCYWQTSSFGGLNEKHLYSILSCYYWNVHNNKHKIILWLENTELNEYAEKIEQYAEIRQFDITEEIKNITFEDDFSLKWPEHFEWPKRSGRRKKDSQTRRHSNYVRLILLHNYGGCWFDLDCFFLRCWDPLFSAFPEELCFYYMVEEHANNAVVLSLQPQLPMTRRFIKFLAKRNRSWGFADGGLPIKHTEDALVLPIEWFNPSYGGGAGYGSGFFSGTAREWNFDNFYKGVFCHHWHNSWNAEVAHTSICGQLVKIIQDDMVEA